MVQLKKEIIMQFDSIHKESSWNVLINENRQDDGKRQPSIKRPHPINQEIAIDRDKVLLSITDTKGVITYCNEDFVETCGYAEYELAGAAHNIIRHPDMPRVIFKLMWARIQTKNNIIAIVKNLAKSGKYYWVMTDFVIKQDSLGNITGYKAYRRPAPRKAIEAVIPIYLKLRNIEEMKGMQAAEDFLVGYLESLNVTYDDFIESLIIDNYEDSEVDVPVSKEEKKSFFKRLFGY